VIHSGFKRTRESAELIMSKRPNAKIIEDERIRELDLSDEFEGGKWDSYNALFTTWGERFTKSIEGSENRQDVKNRMGGFLDYLEETYKDKKILVVGHGGPLFALECAAKGLTPKESKRILRRER